MVLSRGVGDDGGVIEALLEWGVKHIPVKISRSLDLEELRVAAKEASDKVACFPLAPLLAAAKLECQLRHRRQFSLLESGERHQKVGHVPL